MLSESFISARKARRIIRCFTADSYFASSGKTWRELGAREKQVQQRLDKRCERSSPSARVSPERPIKRPQSVRRSIVLEQGQVYLHKSSDTNPPLRQSFAREHIGRKGLHFRKQARFTQPTSCRGRQLNDIDMVALTEKLKLNPAELSRIRHRRPRHVLPTFRSSQDAWKICKKNRGLSFAGGSRTR